MDGNLRVPQRPARNPDAKVFFANERTLLSWIHPVTFLLSMSLALMSIAQSQSEVARATMLSTGVAMMSLSVLWLLYALHVYYKRLRAIRNRKTDGFDESFGPSAMVLGLLFLCIAAATIFIVNPFGQADGPQPEYLAPATTEAVTTTPMARRRRLGTRRLQSLSSFSFFEGLTYIMAAKTLASH